MNLHEFQAKELFRNVGIPVTEGAVAASPDEAVAAARKLGGDRWVVKAQVHAGGRGKVGGVKLLDSLDAVKEFSASLLGTRLVTHQSGHRGQPVNQVLVEMPCAIERELYLGAVVDRNSRRVAFMASEAGGMDIEEVASSTPEKILSTLVDPVVGLQPYQCRRFAFALGLKDKQVQQLTQIMLAMYRLFMHRDLSMIEINPLVVTQAGDLLALDAKVNIDDNALFRQQAILAMRDKTQEDEKECRAQEFGLNYVTLDGSIACMVNGAGLAMATMDIIKLYGGEPANFLDVGGGTTADKVAEAFKIILEGDQVKAILVNIFGGIVRCDLIAEGIIKATQSVGVKVPVVVRLEGTNAEQGRELLNNSGLDLIAADNLPDAAEKVVKAAKGVA